VKAWEIIADNLSKAGWSWGCVSALDREGRTIWIADAHRDDGKRFVVHADEKLSAFVELEREALTVTFYLVSNHADSCPFAKLSGFATTRCRGFSLSRYAVWTDVQDVKA
jgi:hypothetical protein